MSITTTSHSPYIWSPAAAPMIWEVYSSTWGESTRIDYKYVFDIYINDVFFMRIKQKPNATGYATIDVSPFCEQSLDLASSNWLLGEDEYFKKGEGLSGRVYCYVGEEYRTADGAALEIHNGTNDDIGNPTYGLYANGTVKPVRFFGGVLNNLEAYKNEVNNSIVKEFEMNVGSSGTAGRFLTEFPHSTVAEPVYQKLQTDDNATLTFLNKRDGGDGVVNDYVYSAEILFYQDGVYVSSTYWPNITTTYNGGPLILCNGSGVTGDETYDLMQLNVTPSKILSKGQVANEYFIRLTDKVNNCMAGTPISLIQAFKVVDDDCSGFRKWRFGWLNKWGGLDFFNFVKRDTEKITSKKQAYYKLPSHWTSGAYTSASINPMDYGMTTNMNTKETMFSASTDWLTEVESTFLEGMISSSFIFVQDLEDTDITIPIKLKTASYEIQNNKRSTQLYQVNVDFSYNFNTNKQKI